MGHPPRRIADKIGIRITLYGGGFCGYIIYSQKLEKDAFHLCLSFLVASEIMSGGHGPEETNQCPVIELKFQKGIAGF